MTSLVICDWLDVTTPPTSDSVNNIFSLLCTPTSDITGDMDKLTMRVGSGTVRLEKKKAYHRISASGSALAHIRAQGLFNSYLDTIASSPHNITRLDCARDTEQDFADLLPKLRSRYREKKVFLSRKGLDIKFITSLRDSDNRETGTFYAGHRSKSRLTARIYDKSNEVYEKTGEVLPCAITRSELTVKSDVGATLRDAAEPERLFWHFMGKDLVKRPKDLSVGDWSSEWAQKWTANITRRDPIDRLNNLIENSDFLEVLNELADELGPNGRTYLANALRRRCHQGKFVKPH